jgi:hypothetical protein
MVLEQQETTGHGGRWIRRDVDVHLCNRPGYNSSIHVGDLWQCNGCNVVWRVNGFDFNPFPTVIKWEKYSSDTSGMYAPGTK